LAVATSPSGRTALSGGSDRIAKLWDLATGRVLKTFEGHTDSVDAVAIAPDGRMGMTGSLDKTIRLWDLTGTGSGV
jgi:WD40 repeat protein